MLGEIVELVELFSQRAQSLDRGDGGDGFLFAELVHHRVEGFVAGCWVFARVLADRREGRARLFKLRAGATAGQSAL